MNQWLQLRRLRGPAFLVLLGIMFLLGQWHVIGFHRSWPLLLILAGVLSLAERAALSRVDPGQFAGGMPGAYAPYPPSNYPQAANAGGVPPAPAAELARTEHGSLIVDPPATGSSELDSEKGRY